MKHPHKESVSEEFLVKRHLKLEGEADIPWDKIALEIDHLMGIDEVKLDPATHTLTVAYDASYRSLKEVEEILDKHFLHTAQGWWTKMKKNWYEYTDENVKDNIKYKPVCCHPHPEKPRKK